MSIKILGIGVGLPSRVVCNDELSQHLDTNDNWISTRTGIKERRVCEDGSLTDISVKASVEAIEASGIGVSDIDLIICATMQGDCVTPSLACLVQRELGISCPAFDINAACSGFIYALEVASGFIEMKDSRYKNILIVCAECMSKLVDWTKRDASVLFGDGAGACVVSAGRSVEYINLYACGDDRYIHQRVGGGNCPFRKNALPEYLGLNGQEVYKFAISAVTREIEKVFETLDIKPGNIDNFILHQANRRIIDAVRESLDLPSEKFPVNIDKYGNTSSASILILLYELVRDGKVLRGDRLCLVAFGGGLTSASCVLTF